MSDPVYLFLFAVSTLCAVVGTVTGILGLRRAAHTDARFNRLQAHLVRKGVILDGGDGTYPEPGDG